MSAAVTNTGTGRRPPAADGDDRAARDQQDVPQVAEVDEGTLHHLAGIADHRALHLHHGDEEREQRVLCRHRQPQRHHAVFHAAIL
ncbi:hypothetical protein Ppa06_38040 [Planomonospora parontospora subsp. parontospora]|uniref:Uncharacterized protein n=2 Tax=Planomonospora parontospora TaxID=58119 RepID=A0AA37F5R5_9ACTN|nr:hypothetical protein [Planomonospora parontospora]GGK77418.1 hypothetical protein GCM10010126_40870 [Planomonospora parontospora]GII10006.1 hypothetical protein Ppa06_38040 [Planomonospora parontospora subsp. parontospora]